jgi:hypothetical protein
VKIHVGRLEDGRYAICDDRGERCIYRKARGFQAAAKKWIKKFGVQPESMVSYRGRHRMSEWVMTLMSLKDDAGKEKDHDAGTANSG